MRDKQMPPLQSCGGLLGDAVEVGPQLQQPLHRLGGGLADGGGEQVGRLHVGEGGVAELGHPVGLAQRWPLGGGVGGRPTGPLPRLKTLPPPPGGLNCKSNQSKSNQIKLLNCGVY